MIMRQPIDPAWWDDEQVDGVSMRRVLADRDIRAIFQFLHNRGWSWAAIAQATDIGEQRIREIANGRRRIENYDVYVRIATGLHIPRDYLGVGLRPLSAVPSVPNSTPPAAMPPPRAAALSGPFGGALGDGSQSGEGAASVIDVPRWTGAEARLLREALRMSQREFAARLGVGPRTVAYWDAQGAKVIPRPLWQAALDTKLAQADQEAQKRFAAAVVAVDKARTVDSKDEDEHPQLASWRGVPGHINSGTRDSGLAALQAGLVPVGETDIAVIRGMLSSLTAADHQFGGGFARRAAAGFLVEVVQPRLAAPGPLNVRGPLNALAAEFEMRVAWMHLDMGDAEGARGAARQAFRRAQESADMATCSWVMSMSALLETWLGNPKAAVAYAHAGVGFASDGPDLVGAFAYGKLARALAFKGDASEALWALRQARELFERAPDSQAELVPSTIRDGYNGAYVLDEEAHCYRDLGHDEKALALSEQSLGLRGPDRFARNRAFATGNAVLSIARLGEIERACEGGLTLLQLASLLDSQRVASRLEAVLEVLAQHRTVAVVRDLGEQVRVAGFPNPYW